MFIIPFELYSIITDEHVYMYIDCALGNQFYGLQAKIRSKDFAARQSMPVKNSFECE